MKRTFVCASSCIKHYVQPFIWLLWDVRSCPYVCLYCMKKLLHKLHKSTGTRMKNFFFNEQKVGMLLQKRADTRGVGISNMSKSIYLLTTTPTSHTHRFHPHPPPANHTHAFHPVSTIVIHTFNLCASGWNLWVWLVSSGCGCKEVYRFPHITYP